MIKHYLQGALWALRIALPAPLILFAFSLVTPMAFAFTAAFLVAAFVARTELQREKVT